MHLIDPQGIDLRHPEKSPGICRWSRIEDIDLILVLENDIDHVLEHGRLFESRIHGCRFDEVFSFGGYISKLEEPSDLVFDVLFRSLNGFGGINFTGMEIG